MSSKHSIWHLSRTPRGVPFIKYSGMPAGSLQVAYRLGSGGGDMPDDCGPVGA